MSTITVKTIDGKDVEIDTKQLADQDIPDPTKEINTKDDFISKLEVVLGLSNRVLYGLFIFWVCMTAFAVVVSTLGSITIDTGNGSVAILNLNADAAMQVVTMVFPIVSSLVTLLLGYILGRRRVE